MNIFHKYEIFRSAVTNMMMQKYELIRMSFFIYNLIYNYKRIYAGVHACLHLLVLIDAGLWGKCEDNTACSLSFDIDYICR
jgi:hypothetical protein